MKKNTGAILSALLWPLSAAAAAPKAPAGAAPLAAARREGAVVWYAIDLPFNRAVVDAFHKRYPEIKLDAVLTGGVQVVQRFTGEREAGAESADCVTTGAAELLPELRRKGYFARLDALPHWTARDAWTKDPNGSYFFYANFKVGLMYNEKILSSSEAPASYAELVEPRWKGRVAIVDPATGGFGLPFFRFIAAQPGLGMDWIRRLGQNRPLLSFQAAQLSEAVSTGMRPVGFLRDSEAKGAKAKGAPVAFKTAKEGFLLHMMPVAVSSKAPHPNAARLFADWLMSDEAQKELEAQGVGLSVRSSAEAVKKSGAWLLDIEAVTPADTRAFLDSVNGALKGA